MTAHVTVCQPLFPPLLTFSIPQQSFSHIPVWTIVMRYTTISHCIIQLKISEGFKASRFSVSSYCLLEAKKWGVVCTALHKSSATTKAFPSQFLCMEAFIGLEMICNHDGAYMASLRLAATISIVLYERYMSTPMKRLE